MAALCVIPVQSHRRHTNREVTGVAALCVACCTKQILQIKCFIESPTDVSSHHTSGTAAGLIAQGIDRE